MVSQGGLDSTLALLVCHQARKLVPDIHIIGYTLPNHGNTTSYTYNNALDLMRALDVEMHEVAIEEGVQAHLKQIGILVVIKAKVIQLTKMHKPVCVLTS